MGLCQLLLHLLLYLSGLRVHALFGFEPRGPNLLVEAVDSLLMLMLEILRVFQMLLLLLFQLFLQLLLDSLREAVLIVSFLQLVHLFDEFSLVRFCLL